MSQKPDSRRGCCVNCDEDYREEIREQGEDAISWIFRPFIVCSFCGNKRCPKATDHRLDCTRSNEPGQPGSSYPAGPTLMRLRLSEDDKT